MKTLRVLPALVLTLAAAAAASAEAPIQLSPNDVAFTWQLTKSGVKYKSTLCGFRILGNHLSRDLPRSEWDLNIDQVIVDDMRIAGISAGAFQVLSNERKKDRTPRPPIVALSFAFAGEPQPVPARIVGAPNADNAIRAMLETQPATRLFAALYSAQPIMISLSYQDGSSDVLQVQGWQDRSKFAGEKNGYLQQCMHDLGPSPAAAARQPAN
jgi:hypothetical protein